MMEKKSKDSMSAILRKESIFFYKINSTEAFTYIGKNIIA